MYGSQSRLTQTWFSFRFCTAVAALFLCLAVIIPQVAAAQSTAGTSTMQVLDDMQLQKTEDLRFGAILAGATGGTITVAVDGDVTTGGSVTTLGGTGPAAFVLTRSIGQDFLTYRAPTISDTIEIVHDSDPSVTMTVRDFTTDFNRTQLLFGFIRIPAYFFRETYDFRIGGTLDVDGDQLPGTYTGTFTVIVDYD